MKTTLLRNAFRTTTLLAAVLVLAAGCKKTADNSVNYKSAINDWYSAHPACLWSESQKFPTQVAASNEDQTAPYARPRRSGPPDAHHHREKDPHHLQTRG